MEIIRHKIPTLFILSLLWLGCANDKQTNTQNDEDDISFFTPSKVDVDDVQRVLRSKLEATQTGMVLGTDSLKPFSEIQQFYTERNFQSVWFNKAGLTKKANDALAAIDSLQFDGIPQNQFPIDFLKDVLAKCSSDPIVTEHAVEAELALTQVMCKATKLMVLGASVDSNKEWKIKNDTLFKESVWLKGLDSMSMFNYFKHIRPAHPWYQKFREEYIRIYNQQGSLDEMHLLSLRDSTDSNIINKDLSELRKKLFQETGMPADTLSSTWGEDLTEGLKAYQHLHQVKKTGHLDTTTIRLLAIKPDQKLKVLALNMERLRDMGHEFKQPYIWVVVPKMELDYVDNDSVEFNMRVVVGRSSRPTPSLKSKIENIVLSPPWTVPPTIMKEEVVPGIARRGGSYLARRGLKAYDSRGRVVNASAINASNYKRFSIGQAPGYRSSLGEVKFNMINPWAIYLHDTPHREDFVKSFRAFSSGCIRVHHPKEFAEFLLKDTANYSYQKIDSICKLRKTKFIPMNRNIDVHVVYLTNALDSVGNIMYLKDIYGWDKKLLN